MNQLPSPVTLPVLRDGEHAVIAGIRGTTSDAKRLADMGLVGGVVIAMVRAGHPCIIRLQEGPALALGRAHQQSIELSERNDWS